MIDRSDLSGPFDIIGDIHGCADELAELLDRLGYDNGLHPQGRRLVFLGDFTDRGPRNLDALTMAKTAVEQHGALAVCGNHDFKLQRYLAGRSVTIDPYGLAQTVPEIDPLPSAQKDQIRAFLESLPDHYLLDGGDLVIAHAGLKEAYHGVSTERARRFCLFGDTTGKTDDQGRPVRRDWALQYRGRARVVYGHTPVRQALWRNRTINIDTGCVFGGVLTALRYPELELVQVEARSTYYPREF